jgi:TolB-like protein
MPESVSEYQRFFAELKRRHVFRVMAVYGVVGFAILQAVDLVIPALLLPSWTYRLVALLVFAGFPIALIITWAFEITPDGIRPTRPAEPGEVEAIVAQPPAKRWPAGIFALLGIALLAGGWWLGRQSAPRTASDAAAATGSSPQELRLAAPDPDEDARPSIAVLPFADMSERGDHEYFSDGITEELLDVLTKLRALRVAARTSAFAFKGVNLTARQLGDTLDVEYLLEGSVRKAGDDLRITAQLIDVGDGSHLWSEQYDRTFDDVFAIQSEIARAIADALRLSLGLESEELVHPTADLEAYDLYLAGRANLRERGASLRDAARLFEAAIARDSAWAPAWAGLAEAHELMAYYPASWERQPTDNESRLAIMRTHQEAAVAAAEQALDLDSNIASARVALGSVYRSRQQWETSEREYLRALSLDPDNAEVHQQYADMLASAGRVAEGLAAAKRSVVLDPVPIRLHGLSLTQWANGRHEDALETLRRGIAADPDRNVPWTFDSWYIRNMALGRYEAALRFGLPSEEGAVGVTPEQHEALVAALERGDPTGLPAEILGESLLMAGIWPKLGDEDIALAAVEDLVHRHPYESLVWLWVPELDPVRDEPRYVAAAARLNLEGVAPRRTPSTPP